MMKTNKRLVEYFIYPGVIGLDLMGPLEVFSVTTEIFNHNGQGHLGYEAVFSGDRPGPVRLNSGLTVYADMGVQHGRAPDIFLLPGGIDRQIVIQDSDLIAKIQSKAKKARQVVSVCNGAFILAACGLLNGKRATTHWRLTDELAQCAPDTEVDPDAIYTRDGRVYTSAGVTAGIDLALAMVEDHHGFTTAMAVARMLVLYLHRPGGQTQFSAPMELRAKAGKQFSNLHDWIIKNIDKKLTVETLADHAAMSPRNCSRSFTRQTGISPGKYVELVRLNRARELLESGDVTLGAIADFSGFLREERLRRAFVRHLGVTPAQYRVHFQSHQLNDSSRSYKQTD